MLDYYQNHKKRVLAAIDGIYDALDLSMKSGYINRVAERRGISTDQATELVFENDSYELIIEDLIDEVVTLVQALYWAREWGEYMAYPMCDRDTPNPARAEFYTELGKAVTSAPEKAQTKRIKQNSERLHKIVTEFGEWVDNITTNPLGVK